MLKKWNDLTPYAKDEVRRSFVHWQISGKRTFEEWAQCKAFYVTKNDRLDKRHKHCEPKFMAEVK